jgi:L-ribulose-5-phosphate 4-epimerase
MTKEQIEDNYEANTGEVIVNTFKKRDYNSVPAVLVREHGPFTWGGSAAKAAENAAVLEEVAFMAWHTRFTIMSEPQNGIFKMNMDQKLLDKHFFRKHGKDAYYGQK